MATHPKSSTSTSNPGDGRNQSGRSVANIFENSNNVSVKDTTLNAVGGNQTTISHNYYKSVGKNEKGKKSLHSKASTGKWEKIVSMFRDWKKKETLDEDNSTEYLSPDNNITHNYFQQGAKDEKSEKGLKILQQKIPAMSTLDSGLHSTCANGTRENVLSAIRDWKERVTSDEVNSVERLSWIFGPAGCGKSSVMQTVAKQDESGTFTASFFFIKEINDEVKKNNAKYFLTAIAYQLGIKISELGEQIGMAAESEPDSHSKSLEYQFELLIKKPLMAITSTVHSKIVIFIDALDECNEEDAIKIIQLLGTAASTLKLNFLISSRQETYIQFEFDELQASGCSVLYIDVYRQYGADDDIELYLKDQFSKICRKFHLSQQWPSENDIKLLTEQAKGIFIYATAALNYIDDWGFHPPTRLKEILCNQGNKAFVTLDRIYREIFHAHPNHQNLLRILKVFVHIHKIPIFNRGNVNMVIIEQILGFEEGECISIVKGLGSLINITNDETFGIYHTLLLDFLLDKNRSVQFYIGDSVKEVAEWCFQSVIRHAYVPINNFKELIISPTDFKCSDSILSFSAGFISVVEHGSRVNIQMKNADIRCAEITDDTCFFKNAKYYCMEDVSIHLSDKPRDKISWSIDALYLDDSVFNAINVEHWPDEDCLRSGSIFSNVTLSYIKNTDIYLGSVSGGVNVMSNAIHCEFDDVQIEGHFSTDATFNDITGDFEPAQELHIDVFSNASECLFKNVSIKLADLTSTQNKLFSKIAYVSFFRKANKSIAEGIEIIYISLRGTRVTIFEKASNLQVADMELQLCGPQYRILANANDLYLQDATINIYKYDKTAELDHLEKIIYTSSDVPDPSALQLNCDEKTFTEILKVCDRWTRLFNKSSSILWLFGPEEGVRRLIMQRVVERADIDMFLASSFYIKKPLGSLSINDIFPSISVQLARNIPELSEKIVPALYKYLETVDTRVMPKTLDLNSQFRELILEPVQNLNLSLHGLRRRIICIHISDEMDNYEQCQKVIALIAKSILQHELPFKFLISCPMLYSKFVQTLQTSRISEHIFMGDSSVEYDNIKFYLDHGLNYQRVQPISMNDISSISKLCEGDFMYASILVRLVIQQGIAAFYRLKILNSNSAPPQLHGKSKILDQLFTAILNSHPRKVAVLRILKALVHLPSVKIYITRRDVTIQIVEGILGLQEGEGVRILEGLSSILYLHDENQRVGLYDPSLTEYLRDPERSGQFFVGGRESAIEVSKWCYDSFMNWKNYSQTPRPQKAHLNHLRTILGTPKDENDSWVTNDTRRYRH